MFSSLRICHHMNKQKMSMNGLTNDLLFTAQKMEKEISDFVNPTNRYLSQRGFICYGQKQI